METNPTFHPSRRPVYRHPRPSYWSRISYWLALLQLPGIAVAWWFADMPGHPPGIFVAMAIVWPVILLSFIGLVLGMIALCRPPPHWRAWVGLGLNLSFLGLGIALVT